MGKEFSIVPRRVVPVETRFRRIQTDLPHPDSVATLEKLRQFEPQSMRGQPPLVWDRAEDIFVGLGYLVRPQFTLKAGYRILEGGADVDSVYNFALVHYLCLGAVLRL